MNLTAWTFHIVWKAARPATACSKERRPTVLTDEGSPGAGRLCRDKEQVHAHEVTL